MSATAFRVYALGSALSAAALAVTVYNELQARQRRLSEVGPVGPVPLKAIVAACTATTLRLLISLNAAYLLVYGLATKLNSPVAVHPGVGAARTPAPAPVAGQEARPAAAAASTADAPAAAARGEGAAGLRQRVARASDGAAPAAATRQPAAVPVRAAPASGRTRSTRSKRTGGDLFSVLEQRKRQLLERARQKYLEKYGA